MKDVKRSVLMVLNGNSVGKLDLDGHDISSSVSDIEIHCDPPNAPRVVLGMKPQRLEVLLPETKAVLRSLEEKRSDFPDGSKQQRSYFLYSFAGAFLACVVFGILHALASLLF